MIVIDLKEWQKLNTRKQRIFFSVGNMEFAIELQLANQHLGASREITRTLKILDMKNANECQKKRNSCLLLALNKKLCGIGVIGVGVIFYIFWDAGCIYCIVSNWKHFMCFKRKCCNCM